MAKSKLRNCPFCGGTATVAEVTNYNGRRVWEVSCDECPGAMLLSFETEDNAIEAWNRRSEDGRE